jgi:hypothetical protein
MNREQEIDQIMAVLAEGQIADQSRVDRIARENRIHLKKEVLAGRRIPLHANCRFCMGRLVDLLPEDLRACALNSGRVNNAPLTAPVEERSLE